MDVRRNHPAYEAPAEVPTPVPTPWPPEPRTPTFGDKMARTPLPRLIALIAATCTAGAGLVTATGAAAVNVIEAWTDAKARRTNAEIDRRLDAIETRVNGDFGLPLETAARQKKDAEIDDEISRLRAELREQAARPATPRRR